MAEGLERDIELLEIQEVSAWRQQLGAAAAGLFTAGPIGLVASLLAFQKLDGNWRAWALIACWLHHRWLTANGAGWKRSSNDKAVGMLKRERIRRQRS